VFLLSCVAFFLIYESFITPKKQNKKLPKQLKLKRLIEKISKTPNAVKQNKIKKHFKPCKKKDYKKKQKLRGGIELLLERNLCCVFMIIIIIVYVEIIIHSAIFC